MTGRPMRYLELFAGAGGMSRGLEAAGMTCVAHAEIEPHARAVLRHHWPDTPLHGDVTTVDWTQYQGQVDLVAGGSPCQDLSVAGKRAGLAGSRSNLFYELIRAWDQTNATYCLWENVDGARSSNQGADFAAVLSAFVGADVATPKRWASAGVASGPAGVAAWRVLDLQHFGPPQRRRRIFVLAARTGGVDPAEVLALSESVCGHPAPRQHQREITAARARAGVARCLDAGEWRGPNRNQGGMIAFGDEAMDWASHGTASGGGVALNGDSIVGSLIARGDSSPCVDRGQPAVVQPTYAIKGSVIGRAETAGSQYSMVKEDGMFCLQTNEVHGVVQTFDARGNGDGALTNDTNTVAAFSRGGFGNWTSNESVTALCARDGKDQSSIVVPSDKQWPKPIADTLTVAYAQKWGLEDQHINSGAGLFQLTPTGRPRRLTPLECERLMGWADRWTEQGVKEDGTTYALSDTARYKLCGNGVGSPVAQWIATRLVEEEALCPV